MTTGMDYAVEIARLNSLTEQALAQYTEDVQDQRFGQHTAKLLELFDGWIERAEEINALPGTQGVLIPGDPERKMRADRTQNGVPLPDDTWAAIVNTAREVGVSALRWYAGSQGITIAVCSLGKAKTGTQMTAIPMLMLIPDPSAVWVSGVLHVVVAITIASGIDYALTYARESGTATGELARI